MPRLVEKQLRKTENINFQERNKKFFSENLQRLLTDVFGRKLDFNSITLKL
jgi:hypothetical protein